MPCSRSLRASRARRVLSCARAALAGVCLLGSFLTAKADVLHLNSGGSVEGTIVEQDERAYKVRTTVGTITVPIDAVARLEKKPSILDEYLKRRSEAPETPAGQVDLAKWCEDNGLTAGWRTHLERAIELDPDCAAARAALGFVNVGGMWVDGRTVVKAPAAEGDDQESNDDNAAARDDEAVVAAIQGQWTVQIRAIRNNKLNTSVKRLQQDGRERVLRIQDPLAILPLTRLLSSGNSACRDTLVKALSQFPQDEATMNLAVLALVDDEVAIRAQALAELKRRSDPRVIPQFREALASDSDSLVRRAAIALGLLEAAPAVPDLIAVLTAARRKPVEVSVRYFFGEYPVTFSSPTVVSLGNAMLVSHAPVVGVGSLGKGWVVAESEYQILDVTVYRTEVLEALKRITKQNFGFDAAAWGRWHKEQEP